MTNPYFIQLAGVILIVAGLAALLASASAYGRPLTRDERFRMGKDNRNAYRLPLNLATVASTTFVLSGAGILTWSNFNLCAYLAYWLPSLSESIRFWISCR